MSVSVMSDDDRGPSMGEPIRWQTNFYRSYLAHALKKLANDPNPAVQRIGEHMDRCLRCPNTERCSECPFAHSAETRIRAIR